MPPDHNIPSHAHTFSTINSIAIFSNAVLVFFLVVNFRVTPTDLLIELQRQSNELKARIATVEGLERGNKDTLDARLPIFTNMSNMIHDIRDNQWYTMNNKSSWQQLFDSNPSLVIPQDFRPFRPILKPASVPKTVSPEIKQ